jgi:hypothetical protein
MSDRQPAGGFLLYQTEDATCKPFLQIRQNVVRQVKCHAQLDFEASISKPVTEIGKARKSAPRHTDKKKGLK